MGQPDSILPNAWNPQSFDRFSYVKNNPLRYTDPSGHRECESITSDGRCEVGLAPPRGCSSWGGFNDYMTTLKYPDVKSISEWTISDDGIEFIMGFEGFSGSLYNDGCKVGEPCFNDVSGKGKGHCSIGYGHLVHHGPCDGRPNEAIWADGISESEGYTQLITDIGFAEKRLKEGVEKHDISTWVTQSQYDALVSLIFNWGEHHFFEKYTTKRDLLAAGDYYGLAQHYRVGPIESNGVVLPGLVERRNAEAEMILKVVGP